MMRKKVSLVLFLLVLCGAAAFAQVQAVSFANLDSLQQIEQRKVVIFIYTDWCRYCHRMEHRSFSDKQNIDLLNNDFYFVRLHAESKETIEFSGHRFEFRPTGINTGIHELAEALATIDGQVAYPSICVLNEAKEIVFQYQQFLGPAELATVLKALQ